MFRTSSPRRREEPPARVSTPVPKRDIYADPAVIREILQTIKTEDPTFTDNEKNRNLIFHFLWEHDAADGFTLHNVRVAVKILGGKIERVQPPAPPPPPVVEEPVEVLEPGQLSIHASKWELRQPSVTPAQLKDYLRRVRAAEAAKK